MNELTWWQWLLIVAWPMVLGGVVAAYLKVAPVWITQRQQYIQSLLDRIRDLVGQVNSKDAQLIAAVERAASAEARSEALKAGIASKLDSVHGLVNDQHDKLEARLAQVLAQNAALIEKVTRLEEAAAEVLKPKSVNGGRP